MVDDRYGALGGEDIKNKSVNPSEFNTDNDPVDGQALSWSESSGKMTWRYVIGLGKLTTTTVDYQVQNDDDIVICNPSGTDIDVTLPTAVDIQGRVYTIKRISPARKVTVLTYGSQTIDGKASWALTNQWDVLTVTSDGSNWYVI